MADDRKNRSQSRKSTEKPTPVGVPASGDLSKASEEHANNLAEIAKLEEKIAKIARMNFESAKGQALQIKKIAELAEMRNEFLEDTKRIEKNIEDILDKEEKSEKSIVQLSRQRRDNLKDTRNLSDEIAKSIRLANSETKDLSDIGKVVTQNMQATVNFSKEFGNVTERAGNLLQSGVNLSEEFMNKIEETNQVKREYRDMEFQIAKDAEKAAKGQYDAESVQQDLIKKRQKLRAEEEEFIDKTKEFLKNKNKMSKEDQTAKLAELQMEKQILRARNLQLGVFEEQNEALKEASKTAEKTLGVMDKITSGDFKGALLQKFGLDDLNKQLKEKVGGALVNAVQAVKSGDLKGAFSAAGDGLKSLTKLAGAFTLALGIGAILKLGSFLLDTFMKADQEVADLGKNFGISKNEAKELHHTAVDVANEMGVVGIHSEQIAKGLEQVSQNLGGIDLTGAFSSGNAAVQQMVKDTTLLTEKFGLSAEEAGNMSNIAAIAGKSVGEMSMMSSKLGNGIFSAKESMKILAGIPKSVVSQMSKMPEAMIKTAQHAKMLGMNMKQIADIGRKSLDIEQSLEAEMEARALIGKDINLDAMRAAALNGDQETVMNELLKTAGSMEDFNNMNVLQKEALAKAAGMEVDQMAEMLGKQEELNKAGLTQAKVKELQAMNEKDLAKEIANTNDKDKKAYLEKLQAEKKSESTQAAMASLMQRLQELAVKLVTPIMDMVDAFLNGQDGADAMGGIIDGIGGAIKAIVPYIKAIASVIGFLLKPLGWIGSMFKSTEEATHGVAEGAKGVASAIKPVESGFGTILKAAVGIGAIFAGKKLLGGVGKVVGKVMGAPGRLLGFGGKKGEDAGGGAEDAAGKTSGAAKEAAKGKNIISTILDKIKSIIDSLKGVVQSGIKFVKEVGKDLIKMLAELIKEVGNLLNRILDLVKNVGSNLISTISKLVSEFGNLLTNLLDVIGNVGTKLISVVGDLLNGIVNLLNSVGTNLLSTLNKLLQGIGTILNSAVEIVVNVGTKLAEGAMKILNIIMKGLANAANTLPTIMGALGKAVVAFFQPMAALVNPMVIGGIIIFTAAMIGLGYAFKLLGEGIGAAAPGITAFFDGVGGVIEKVGEAIAKVIETITTSIIRLQDIDGKKMILAAYGITAIAGALAAFGGGSAIAGLGSALGKLFDEDPVDKFNRFAAINASGLQSVATAINTLGQAIQNFSNISGGLNLDKVDEMIEKIKDLKAAQTSAAISDLATAGVGAVTSFVGKIFGGSEEQKTQSVGGGSGGSAVATGGGGNPMASVEKKLDTLIGLFSQAANQPTVIKFGEKVVDEIKGQIDFKKAYQVKVDNTYGRTT